MPEGITPIIHNKKEEEIPREGLFYKIAEMVCMPPGDFLDLLPVDFMKLNKVEKTKAIKEVLSGLRNNVDFLTKNNFDKSTLLEIDAKRKTIASESIEAGLLTPQEAEDLL